MFSRLFRHHSCTASTYKVHSIIIQSKLQLICEKISFHPELISHQKARSFKVRLIIQDRIITPFGPICLSNNCSDLRLQSSGPEREISIFWEYYIRIKLRINYLSTECNEFLFSGFYFRSFYLSFSFHISSELIKLRKLNKK